MSEAEFRIPSGDIRIADGEIRIGTNPAEGLGRIYRRHRIATIAFVVVAVFLYGVIFLVGLPFGTGFKIVVALPPLALISFVIYGEISARSGEDDTVRIRTASVKRVEYDWVKSIDFSKIKIVYTDEDGDEQSQHALITLFGLGEEGRLDNALSVFGGEGIETCVGTYYTGRESSDSTD